MTIWRKFVLLLTEGVAIGMFTLFASNATSQQTPPTAGFEVLKQEIRIPMAAAGATGLQALLLMPVTGGDYPLVLMTNASYPSDREDREMGPGILQPEAIWFVQRGWAVAIVLRRGYGSSGGDWRHEPFSCGKANLDTYGDEDAKDLRAAYDHLVRLPDIDGNRVIVVGDSTGGTAAVAFALHPPPSLKAAISISGYWPAMLLHPWACKSHTASSFGDLSRAAHTPMLWIYADNEYLIGSKEAVKFHEGFLASGGSSELSTVKQSRSDGQLLFRDSPGLWGPVVQRFLEQYGLPSVPLYPDPAPPKLKLPLVFFSDDAQKAFLKFQALGPYRAFAVSPGGGRWSYSSGKLTLKLAVDEALDRCGNPACMVVAKSVP